MGLHANTIDLCAVLLDELDDALGAGGFGSCGFDVVVVVEELCARVGGGGSSEGDGDVGFADGIVEDVGAVGAVFVERFVDDVPLEAFALVVGDFLRDVVLQDADEGGVVEVAVRDPVLLAMRPCAACGGDVPAGQLVVPYECVAPKVLAVLCSEVGDDVAVCEIERTARGLDGVPLPESAKPPCMMCLVRFVPSWNYQA